MTQIFDHFTGREPEDRNAEWSRLTTEEYREAAAKALAAWKANS